MGYPLSGCIPCIHPHLDRGLFADSDLSLICYNISYNVFLIFTPDIFLFFKICIKLKYWKNIKSYEKIAVRDTSLLSQTNGLSSLPLAMANKVMLFREQRQYPQSSPGDILLALLYPRQKLLSLNPLFPIF